MRIELVELTELLSVLEDVDEGLTANACACGRLALFCVAIGAWSYLSTTPVV